jgi:Ca2+-binding RTX toxin-like protein
MNTISGGAGNDLLIGTDGNDYMLGLGGNDTLQGALGNDTLDGGPGSDRLVGGPGDDVYIFGSGDTIVENANEGIDTVISSESLALGNNLENLTLTGSATNGSGNALNNVLRGNDLSNRLRGLAGNDTLYGSAGDTLDGGAGDDAYYLETSEALIIEDSVSGSGVDTVFSGLSNYTLAANVENLTLLGEAYQGHGNTQNNVMIGNSVDNYLFADAGHDSLVGGAGNDWLDGSDGNDTLNGGTGNDELFGGDGNDVYRYNLGDGNDIINDWSGVDTIQFGPGITLANLNFIGRPYSSQGGVWSDALDILLPDGGSLRIPGFFYDQAIFNDTRIDQLRFADGTSVALNSLLDRVVFQGTEGDDFFYYMPNAGNQVFGYEGNDQVYAGSGNDTLDGASGNDILYGNEGNDSLIGGSDNDIIDGGNGSDTVNGGTGNDELFGGDGNDVYRYNLGDGNDIINDWSGVDTIQFGPGITLANLNFIGRPYYTSGGTWSDALDILLPDGGSLRIPGFLYDQAIFNDTRIEQLRFADGTSVALNSLLDRVVFQGTDGDDQFHYMPNAGNQVFGYGGNDSFYLGSGNDTADGASGDDILYGNEGNDSLIGGSGNDIIDGGNGSDTVNGGTGNDYLSDGDGNDVYRYNLGDGNDIINDWGGVDTIQFGPGITLANLNFIGRPISSQGGVWSDALDILLPDGGSLQIPGFFYDQAIYNDIRIEQLQFADGTSVALNSLLDRVVFQGTEGTDRFYYMPNAGNQAFGYGGNDEFSAGSGNDTLDGGSGDDVLYGNEGHNILIGAEGNDALYVGSGNDTLSGGTGNDELFGGDGNDVYRYNLGDGNDVIEDAGGVDTLQFGPGIGMANLSFSSDSFGNLFITISGTTPPGVIQITGGAPSPDNPNNTGIEWVQFANGSQVSLASLLSGFNVIDGTAGNDNLIGTDGRDLINGLAGNDTLTGGAGMDTLAGGLGNDTYIINIGDESDVILENAAEGTDTVRSAIDYVLGDNLENLTLTGTAVQGSGNAFNNVIVGNDSSNVLNGLEGNDNLSGGVGDDTLIGGVGNDTLNGGIGNDSLVGGLGNDLYMVDSLGDVIVENPGEGVDSVTATISYTLGASLENLTLKGSANLNGTGNDLNNKISGNAGNNTLIGGLGNDTLSGGLGVDTLIGGSGNDFYVVNDAGDVVVEALNEGVDTVSASISYTLTANLENLVLSGTAALNGTGNTLDNVLTGNSGANLLTGLDGNDTLNGGVGNDTMMGGAGNDVYFVDSAGDVITELVGEGIDTVTASISYTLDANLENLTLTGSAALVGTGNGLNNYLTGNSGHNTLIGGAGNDTLDGGAGNDSMVGGTGDDTYFVNSAGDIIVELAGEGVDTVRSSINYTLGDQLENLTLTGNSNINATGNSFNNVLTGNSGNNILDGKAGADTMMGGAGNDTYWVDDAGDVIVEAVNEGTDLVRASISYSLAAFENVENLTLLGTDALLSVGNTLNNYLTGNSGNNTLMGGTGNDTLDGGVGNDSMVGGTGDDTYFVNSAGDIIVELAGEGEDTVRSSINYTLGFNLENLTLTGSSNISGTGNALDNVLTGNSRNNTLDGGAGNDTLNGGAGNDSLLGGAGDDTYLLAVGHGVDTIHDASGALDRILFGSGATMSNVALFKSGNNLVIGYTANNTDQVTVSNQFTTGTMESLQLADGHSMTSAQLNTLVQNMTSYATTNGIALSSINDVKANTELMTMIANTWS